jgi:hypothetical protein
MFITSLAMFIMVPWRHLAVGPKARTVISQGTLEISVSSKGLEGHQPKTFFREEKRSSFVEFSYILIYKCNKKLWRPDNQCLLNVALCNAVKTIG